MPIAASDILVKLSIKSGSAGNQSAQPDPNASLGKYVSTTQLSGTALHNLFDAVSGAENAASTVEYRCVFVHNAHATLTLLNAVAYVDGGDPAGGAAVAIAVDNIAASSVSATAAQAAEIANETTAPTGVGAFSTPTTAAAGLALGNIGPGQVKAFWVRRSAANSAAVDSETVNLGIAGDTGA